MNDEFIEEFIEEFLRKCTEEECKYNKLSTSIILVDELSKDNATEIGNYYYKDFDGKCIYVMKCYDMDFWNAINAFFRTAGHTIYDLAENKIEIPNECGTRASWDGYCKSFTDPIIGSCFLDSKYNIYIAYGWDN